MIKGIDVILYEKQVSGRDEFNHPFYTETPVLVHDVLVAPSSSDDIITSTNLVGKQARYTLGIPKGDTHNWENSTVEFFGKKYRTYGFVIEGIEANVPTRWHKKVMCDIYD